MIPQNPSSQVASGSCTGLYQEVELGRGNQTATAVMWAENQEVEVVSFNCFYSRMNG